MGLEDDLDPRTGVHPGGPVVRRNPCLVCGTRHPLLGVGVHLGVGPTQETDSSRLESPSHPPTSPSKSIDPLLPEDRPSTDRQGHDSGLVHPGSPPESSSRHGGVVCVCEPSLVFRRGPGVTVDLRTPHRGSRSSSSPEGSYTSPSLRTLFRVRRAFGPETCLCKVECGTPTICS